MHSVDVPASNADEPDNSTQNAWCTGRHIGYEMSNEVRQATGTYYKTTSGGTANNLTRVMILHPIACGLAFIAFLASLDGRTITSSVSGTLVTLLTWTLVLVSLAVDFAAFGIIKHDVNSQASGVFPTAKFGSAAWCLVASFILLSAAIVVVGMSFFGALKDKRGERKRVTETQMPSTTATSKKKRFGIF